jgi:hypothetical protein
MPTIIGQLYPFSSVNFSGLWCYQRGVNPHKHCHADSMNNRLGVSIGRRFLRRITHQLLRRSTHHVQQRYYQDYQDMSDSDYYYLPHRWGHVFTKKRGHYKVDTEAWRQHLLFIARKGTDYPYDVHLNFIARHFGDTLRADDLNWVRINSRGVIISGGYRTPYLTCYFAMPITADP